MRHTGCRPRCQQSHQVLSPTGHRLQTLGEVSQSSRANTELNPQSPGKQMPWLRVCTLEEETLCHCRSQATNAQPWKWELEREGSTQRVPLAEGRGARQGVCLLSSPCPTNAFPKNMNARTQMRAHAQVFPYHTRPWRHLSNCLPNRSPPLLPRTPAHSTT